MTAAARLVRLAPEPVRADCRGRVEAIADDGGSMLSVRIGIDGRTPATAAVSKLDPAWLDLRVGDEVALRFSHS